MRVMILGWRTVCSSARLMVKGILVCGGYRHPFVLDSTNTNHHVKKGTQTVLSMCMSVCVCLCVLTCVSVRLGLKGSKDVPTV